MVTNFILTLFKINSTIKMKNKYNILIPIIVLIIIIFIWLYGIDIVNIFYVNNKNLIDSKELGKVGDTFGLINTLFSGLAFAGIIITILLQRIELQEQRKELRLTREEFQVNRVTNIIYKQIQRIDNTLNVLEFKISHKGINGIPGIYEVNNLIKNIKVNTPSAPVPFIQNCQNDQALLTLSQVVYDSANLISQIINSDEIKHEFEESFKLLFLKNISEIISEYSINSARISEEYLANTRARTHNHDAQVKESNTIIKAAKMIQEALNLMK